MLQDVWLVGLLGFGQREQTKRGTYRQPSKILFLKVRFCVVVAVAFDEDREDRWPERNGECMFPDNAALVCDVAAQRRHPRQQGRRA